MPTVPDLERYLLCRDIGLRVDARLYGGRRRPEIVGQSGGAGGTFSNGCATFGGTGASSASAPGGAGAAKNGSLTSFGWVPATASSGNTAAVAQGGGGGAGTSTTLNLAGTGGGCGGCGGSGGSPGLPGGSSFAVLSFNSSLSFKQAVLSAGTPSAGAAGGMGQAGQTGGVAGAAQGGQCSGGSGGTGGSGGGGGGGPAGISVAAGYSGNAPTISTDSTTTFDSTAAAGGVLQVWAEVREPRPAHRAWLQRPSISATKIEAVPFAPRLSAVAMYRPKAPGVAFSCRVSVACLLGEWFDRTLKYPHHTF